MKIGLRVKWGRVCVCVYARSENERAESADCDWVRWWGRSMGGESGRRISGSRPTKPRQRNASDEHVVFLLFIFMFFCQVQAEARFLQVSAGLRPLFMRDKHQGPTSF